MKIKHALASMLCIVFFAGLAFASGGYHPEVQGGYEYIGNFDGYDYDGSERTVIHIKLPRTGQRVSLPLAEDVEYLYKPNNYAPYNPRRLIFLATIKAIVVNEQVVQIIVLEVPS